MKKIIKSIKINGNRADETERSVQVSDCQKHMESRGREKENLTQTVASETTIATSKTDARPTVLLDDESTNSEKRLYSVDSNAEKSNNTNSESITSKMREQNEINMLPNSTEASNMRGRLKAKTYHRRFELKIELGVYSPIVEEVLNSIETDTIKVLNYKYADPMRRLANPHRNFDIRSHLTVPVNICEWLPLACQIIRWDTCGELNGGRELTWYKCNLCDSFFSSPMFDFLPPGPAAIYGEIIVHNDLQMCNNKNAFKYIIASKLASAIDILRCLVPAFQNLKAFWDNVLVSYPNGEAMTWEDFIKPLFDDKESEFDAVQKYWPSQAETWFYAANE